MLCSDRSYCPKDFIQSWSQCPCPAVHHNRQHQRCRSSHHQGADPVHEGAVPLSTTMTIWPMVCRTPVGNNQDCEIIRMLRDGNAWILDSDGEWL